jgi:hypothetical protein
MSFFISILFAFPLDQSKRTWNCSFYSSPYGDMMFLWKRYFDAWANSRHEITIFCCCVLFTHRRSSMLSIWCRQTSDNVQRAESLSRNSQRLFNCDVHCIHQTSPTRLTREITISTNHIISLVDSFKCFIVSSLQVNVLFTHIHISIHLRRHERAHKLRFPLSMRIINPFQFIPTVKTRDLIDNKTAISTCRIHFCVFVFTRYWLILVSHAKLELVLIRENPRWMKSTSPEVNESPAAVIGIHNERNK